jgi:holo-[acyl-carrier protein] synthase
MGSIQSLSSGIDILDIQRFKDVLERYGDRFLDRIFTKRELIETRRNSASLAARFAAKEAVAKALGTGIGLIGWKDIEVVYGITNRPILKLSGNAAKLAEDSNLNNWSISLSHTESQAIALVVVIS